MNMTYNNYDVWIKYIVKKLENLNKIMLIFFMSKIPTQRISSRRTNYRIVSPIILTIVVITGIIILQSLEVEAQKETARNTPDAIKVTKCQVVNPPSDPVDMNTIIFKDIAKIVHVEKEVFKCITKNGVPVIAMVSLFTEQFENLRS